MKKLGYSIIILVFQLHAGMLFAQSSEVEPNDSRLEANVLNLTGNTPISAEFSPSADVDYFVMEWEKDCMYYLTSIENADAVTPNIELFFENYPENILTSNVGGRNGNNNFRLSGYVAKWSGLYYVKVFDDYDVSGSYKIRFAGGRGLQDLYIHEPDNTINFAAGLEYLAADDTIYGALYPENDIDYYKISALAGEQFTIITLPILDLDVRDTDTYIMLFDSYGNLLYENDDIGTVQTSSGPVNSTFSKISGIFPSSGNYYVAIRSYYNTNFDQTINEANPPMGEYGLYFNSQESESAFSRYPHVEYPTTQSVIIQWCTFNSQITYLKWGENETCQNSIQNADLTQDHSVKISGLLPNTKYYYRVIVATSDSSDCEYFYTAKPSSVKDVKFFVISDSSPYSGFGSTPEQLQVAAQIQNVEYDFGLHAGDVNQHHGEEYDLVFFQPYKDILAHAPIFTCIGNHDTYYDNASTYLSSFNLPYNNPDSTERYYSFNYGHGHFIALDTNIPYSPGSPQYEWLEQDLQSDMRNQTFWTFVYFHHPPWSEGWEGYPGELNVRNYLVPLFETYHVDMIFNGHTHDYERGLLNGVYYIITGGGGAPLENGIQAYDWEHVSVWVNQHHFTYVQINDKSLTLRAINKDGYTIDQLWFDKSTTEIDENSDDRLDLYPDKFFLYQNYPNPFNGSTQIRFDLTHETNMRLSIFSISGRIIRHLVAGMMQPGRHYIVWNGTNDMGQEVASGIYIYKIETSHFTQTRRALFLK